MGLAAVPDCENHSLCQMGSQFASWSEAPPELHSTCDLRPFNPSFSHTRAWYQGMDEAKDKGFLELRLGSHSVQNLYSSKHTHTCLAVYLKITGCGGLFRKASLSEHTFFCLLFHFMRFGNPLTDSNRISKASLVPDCCDYDMHDCAHFLLPPFPFSQQ